MVRFIYGVILGAAGYALVDWVVTENVVVGWYAWLVLLLALALDTLAVHNFFASRAELERKAGWMGLLVIGIPGLIVSAFAVWLFL
jgi:hypothetical protein